MGEHRTKAGKWVGQTCYLCAAKMGPEEVCNRDHVPPARFYAKDLRRAFNPQMNVLPVHTACNSAYRQDEEYFVTSLCGLSPTEPARLVFKDVQRRASEGHDIGLLKTVISQFGTIALPDGSVYYKYDGNRIKRVLWKLIRGLYFQHVGSALPEQTRHRIRLIDPAKAGNIAQEFHWWPAVRDTEGLCPHAAVFDCKWICTTMDDIRGHALAMLIWDSFVALALFHDPTCLCKLCGDASAVPPSHQG